MLCLSFQICEETWGFISFIFIKVASTDENTKKQQLFLSSIWISLNIISFFFDEVIIDFLTPCFEELYFISSKKYHLFPHYHCYLPQLPLSDIDYYPQLLINLFFSLKNLHSCSCILSVRKLPSIWFCWIFCSSIL